MVRGPGTLSMGHQVAEDTHRRDLRECSLLQPDRGAERELLCLLLTAAPVHRLPAPGSSAEPCWPGLPRAGDRGHGLSGPTGHHRPPRPAANSQDPGLAGKGRGDRRNLR